MSPQEKKDKTPTKNAMADETGGMNITMEDIDSLTNGEGGNPASAGSSTDGEPKGKDKDKSGKEKEEAKAEANAEAKAEEGDKSSESAKVADEGGEKPKKGLFGRFKGKKAKSDSKAKSAAAAGDKAEDQASQAKSEAASEEKPAQSMQDGASKETKEMDGKEAEEAKGSTDIAAKRKDSAAISKEEEELDKIAELNKEAQKGGALVKRESSDSDDDDLRHQVKRSIVTVLKDPEERAKNIVSSMDMRIETLNSINNMKMDVPDEEIDAKAPVIRTINGVHTGASPWRRVGAVVINLVIFMALVAPFLNYFMGDAFTKKLQALQSESYNITGFMDLVLAFIWDMYIYIFAVVVLIFLQFCLIFFLGQSLGKIFMRIKIINASGKTAGLFRAFIIREMAFWLLLLLFAAITLNLVKLFDVGDEALRTTFFLFFGIPVLVSFLMTFMKRNYGKSLQDYFAGTYVVNTGRSGKPAEADEGQKDGGEAA